MRRIQISGRRPDLPRRNTWQRRTMARTQGRSRSSGRPRRITWARRFLGWIITANKALLAAVSAGLIGIVTAWVTGLPNLLVAQLTDPAPPLTATGTSSPGSSETARRHPAPTKEDCDLAGVYAVPGTGYAIRPRSTSELSAWLKDAADPDATSGTYVLQARAGQTVVVTAFHTVLIKKVPAPRATVVTVSPPCEGAPEIFYHASVDLDAAEPTPKLTKTVDRKRVPVDRFEDTVTNDSPLILDFKASSAKYDVTWKFRIDYTVDGQTKTAWIPDATHSFHTLATRVDAPALTYTPGNGGMWTARKGSPS
ncbi:hypothetical protein ACGFYM_09985 [Streptomyces sp. NPDC048231]|uniref:hypothetical protein n=1 Tax=unclassified Streptomyces TaxID=2593676 RepID=UPI00342340A8